MNHFCTISTSDHLFKVFALADSLDRGTAYTLHVLLVDPSDEVKHPHCVFWNLKDVAKSDTAQIIIKKYQHYTNKLRWSFKSVFMLHLLSLAEVENVIYLDNDLFFFNEYDFLFDLLKQHCFLLTPHYYKTDPTQNQNWLEANYKVGLYNAGFVGASRLAVETLEWWAECCAYRCEKNSFRGIFDDQKYLDLVPVREENAHIVRHRGCNVAGWNTELCKRVIRGDEILINDQYPIIFIHFNEYTIREMVQGSDTSLVKYFQVYFKKLKEYKSNLTESDLLKPSSRWENVKLAVWKGLTQMGI